MKVEIDFNRCEGHGLCMETLPEVFELRDDGYLYLLTDEVSPDQEALAQTAASACPTQAIKLVT